jgi:hypothetical protein
MENFLSGAVAMASLVAGLFFFRFWWKSRDRFFLYFAVSFWLEGVNRSYLVLGGEMQGAFPVYYGIRLISYGLILLAIWDKNRPLRPGGTKAGLERGD